eukprot:44039-Eustigmatos_ZCMA.PRE.1
MVVAGAAATAAVVAAAVVAARPTRHRPLLLELGIDELLDRLWVARQTQPKRNNTHMTTVK